MILWLSIFILNIADFVITYHCVMHLFMVEANPLALFLFRHVGVRNGFLALLLLKVVMQFAIFLLPKWGQWSVFAAMLLAVAWNIYQMVKA
jgi:hypothetical protein